MTSQADHVAARELSLFAVNTAALYRQRAQPIMTALARKIAAGEYDADKAPAAWASLADDAARAYTKEFGCVPAPFGGFDKATRTAAAAMMADHYAEELVTIAADMMAGRRNKVTGERKPEPPRAFGVAVFDWSHDVYGNPTALFDVPALSYRAPRRVQVGYGDKISEGALAYLRDRFPGWKFEIVKSSGERSAGRASLDIVASEAP